MILTSLHALAIEYQHLLRYCGFDVRQEGIYEEGGWVLLMSLDDYLARLEQGQTFGLLNELCKMID